MLISSLYWLFPGINKQGYYSRTGLKITEERNENGNADVNQNAVQDGDGNHFFS